jgi:hypothetical protein
MTIGSFLINPPFAMTEPPSNTLCHTVYADRTIGLTVTAWPTSGNVADPSSWEVHFQKRDQYSMTLNETAKWYSLAGRWSDHWWNPAIDRGPLNRVPPAALEAVEEWLQMQPVAGRVEK